jgi:hypothetical protein
MEKYKSQGKQATVHIFEKDGNKFIRKEYAKGKGLNYTEASEILNNLKEYIVNLNKLNLETNNPLSLGVEQSNGEYIIVSVEKLRGEGYDMHEHLLLAEDKRELLQLLERYYFLLVTELFLIPPYKNGSYGLSNQSVSVPMDYRPCNFVVEKVKEKYKAINVDTFAPRIWRNENNIKYFPKLEDNFPAVKAKLLHLLMGNIRYMYGRLYGTTLLIITQWGKENLSQIEDIENLRQEAAGIMYRIGEVTINKSENIDPKFENILNNDIQEVKGKRMSDGPYEGSKLIQDFWMSLDKGILRNFK